ncbi:MAG: 50S ribosomal protein L23 [Candidatus Woesearchaeota archaeon]
MIKHPVSTEKAIRLMEAENKIVFVVDLKAKKPEIRKVVEEMFDAKVISVNTLIDRKGQKKAIVKFSPETPAIDIASRLGMM